MGSPCLRPLVGVIWPRGLPLILMEYVTEVTQSIIRFTHLVLKPIFNIISWRQPHSTLSKTLLISSFKAISSIRPLHFLFRWYIISRATSTLSTIRRVDIKALWFSLIISRRKHLSLLAITLEASLEMTLLSLMGLYCVIFVGFFTFGIRIIWVPLNLGGMTPKF